MPMNNVIGFQIGKAGVTLGVVQQLNHLLEYHKHIRISVLAASGRDRASIRALAEFLVSQLSFPCVYTIIGFTIVLRRRMHPRNAARKSLSKSVSVK